MNRSLVDAATTALMTSATHLTATTVRRVYRTTISERAGEERRPGFMQVQGLSLMPAALFAIIRHGLDSTLFNGGNLPATRANTLMTLMGIRDFTSNILGAFFLAFVFGVQKSGAKVAGAFAVSMEIARHVYVFGTLDNAPVPAVAAGILCYGIGLLVDKSGRAGAA